MKVSNALRGSGENQWRMRIHAPPLSFLNMRSISGARSLYDIKTYIYQAPGRHFWGHLGTAPAGLPLRILDGGNGHVAMMTPEKNWANWRMRGKWRDCQILSLRGLEVLGFSAFFPAKKTASASPPHQNSFQPPRQCCASTLSRSFLSLETQTAYVIPCQ